MFVFRLVQGEVRPCLRLHQLSCRWMTPLPLILQACGACARSACTSAKKAVAEARLIKRSVDARSRGGVHFSLTADVTLAQGRRGGGKAAGLPASSPTRSR